MSFGNLNIWILILFHILLLSLPRNFIRRLIEFVDFSNKLPGLFCFFFIDKRDSKTSVYQHQIPQLGFRQQGGLGSIAVAHRIDNRVLAFQFYYSCWYRQTHISFLVACELIQHHLSPQAIIPCFPFYWLTCIRSIFCLKTGIARGMSL